MILGAVPQVEDVFRIGETIVIGGGGGALVLGLSRLWIHYRRRENVDYRLAKTDANTILSVRVDELEADLDKCKEHHADCTQKQDELRSDANQLRDRLNRLETDLITAVITCNSLMKITEWNDAATLMFGHLRSEIVGCEVDILIPAYLRQQHYTASDKAINDLDAVTATEREVVAVKKDGTEFVAHLSLSSFKNSKGEKFFSARITRPRTS